MDVKGIGIVTRFRGGVVRRAVPAPTVRPNQSLGGAGAAFSVVVKLLVGLALLLQGCAGLVGDGESRVGPADTLGEVGGFQVSRGRPGIVIGVPGTGVDTGADRVGRDLARLTGFSAVVAIGPSRPAGGARLDGPRRPESDPGPATRIETAPRPATDYGRRVDEAARGPLEHYVEVRGDGDAGRVEIATAGLDREETWRLKTLFELIRDARVDGRTAPRLEVWVAPPNARPGVVLTAPPSGLPVSPRQTLRIELPRLARTTYREIYTELLGDFLVQSAAFLVPRVH